MRVGGCLHSLKQGFVPSLLCSVTFTKLVVTCAPRVKFPSFRLRPDSLLLFVARRDGHWHMPAVPSAQTTRDHPTIGLGPTPGDQPLNF